MERRSALKLLGTLFVCLTGMAVAKEEDIISIEPTPLNYIFHQNGINNIIINCVDGTELVVPFADIVKAIKD